MGEINIEETDNLFGGSFYVQVIKGDVIEEYPLVIQD